MSLQLEQYPVPENYEELKKAYLKLASIHERAQAEAQHKLDFIRQKFLLLLRKSYSSKADKIMTSLFDEAEISADAAAEPQPAGSEDKPDILIPAHARKAKRKPLDPNLPREQVIFDLSETDKVCPHDGTPLNKIGEETSEELDYVPAKIKVIQNICYKYACPCCKTYLKTAQKPEKAIPKSNATDGLLAHIAVAKFQDHLPLYRQEQIFGRLGVYLPRSTMAHWMIRLGELLQPLVNLICDDILTSPAIHCDETPLQVLKIDGQSSSKKCYMWVLGRWGPDYKAIVYNFDRSRSGRVPLRMMSEYSGYLHVDGYKGYDELCTNPRIKRVGCMAHIRRGFVDTLKMLSQSERKHHGAFAIVEQIKKLYVIEEEIRRQSHDVRQNERQLRAAPIFKELEDLVITDILRVGKQSSYGEALSYASKELPKVKRYLESGYCELDNNKVENAIRPFTLSRKNWLFSDTEKGAEASANIFTLIETAKHNGKNPFEYLRQVIKQLPQCKSLEDYEQLLPYQKIATGLQ